jgi:uncharacterized protein
MATAKPLFTLTAGELDAGGKSYARPIPNGWLVAAFDGSDATPRGDGHLDLRLSKSGTDVVVHGKLSADVEIACSRCLEPVHVTLAPQISVMLVTNVKSRREPKNGNEVEITAAEADVLPYDGEHVILDDIVRDDLLLEVPMIPLCSDSCPGIASTQEAHDRDRPIDPRLAPLLALKQNTKKE